MNFEVLVSHIEQANKVLQNNARLVINRHVTAKAWLTGYYIVEYEQKGEDRAKYGTNLIPELSNRLGKKKYGETTLKLCRQFYQLYPSLSYEISNFLLAIEPIRQSLADELQLSDIQKNKISQSLTDLSVSQLISGKVTEPTVAPKLLFNHLSFTHFTTIMSLKDPLKRTFYEVMSIRGTWSVRELQRQIDSNYYERSGWSSKPEHLATLVDKKAEIADIATDIKSPFVFEFLGLNAKDVVEETDLESAIIDHLQEFILELGMGFCFEARQQKMLIDDRYYKADLVFYHRILKRHVIIELKAHRLDYSDVAQLNMYLGYYRKNIKLADDNDPIGILMCTEVGQEMAEYATVGVDPNLIISKYELQLPSKERILDFLRKENEGLKIDKEGLV